MTEDILKHKDQSLALCRKLVRELENNEEDAKKFFGGEIYKSYLNATDVAKSKMLSIQTKIRNL